MTTRPELAAAVAAALATPGPAWLPGLATPLARFAWDALAHEVGLSEAEYGTARMLAASVSAERDVAARILLGSTFQAPRPIIVETLRPGVAKRYVDLGLSLADADFAAAAVPRLGEALDRLAAVGDVARAVGALVSTVHVAVPDGPDYDVSFSDPRLPFSIFIGVDRETGSHGDLRLAESLLHECMHLQLTLVETVTPLVARHDERYYSPWQGRVRPAQGVLHGIYVFAAIRDFLAMLVENNRVRHDRSYVKDRIHTCSSEISEAATALLAGHELTQAGRVLVHRLLQRSRSEV